MSTTRFNPNIPNTTGRNASKRILIPVVVDISPSTALKGDFGNVTANDLINRHLKDFIYQLLMNKKIKEAGEICFITYSSEVKVSEFIPLSDLKKNIPQFKAVKSGGTRTATALEMAIDATQQRAALINSTSVGSGLYTSCLFLITDGDNAQHDSAETIARATQKINDACKEQDRTKKILPIICGVGSHISDETKKMLSGFSKTFFDGFFYLPGGKKDNENEQDFSKLFGFLSQSLVTSIHVEDSCGLEEDYVEVDYPTGTVTGETADLLLDELRTMIQEDYNEILCTVNG